MPCAMAQELFESSLADLVEAAFVHSFGNGAVLQAACSLVVSGEHRLVKAPHVIAGPAHAKRSFALHVVAAYLRAKTQDQGVTLFQRILAGHSVRKGRAPAKRQQAAERRL